MRRAALALVAVVAIGAIVYGIAAPGSGTNRPRPAPPLPSEVLQGPRTTLETLRGKPALVNFWASWCDPCRKEAPQLERFSRSLGGHGRLVGVDYTDDADAARDFIRRYRWSFPVLSDPDGIAGARFGFSGLPATVVLDARGRIVETLQGPQRVPTLRAALREARKE